MPDITMCDNNECSKRGSCYRYLAIPFLRQSYCSFKEETCDFFWDVKDAGKCRTKDEVDAEISSNKSRRQD